MAISAQIERTAHPLPTALEHMRIDHGSTDILVAEEFLHGANVIAIFQEMGSETMTQGVTTAAFDLPEVWKWLAEDVAVEKQQGIERAILGGGGDVLVHRQMREKGADFSSAHILGTRLS